MVINRKHQSSSISQIHLSLSGIMSCSRTPPIVTTSSSLHEPASPGIIGHFRSPPGTVSLVTQNWHQLLSLTISLPSSFCYHWHAPVFLSRFSSSQAPFIAITHHYTSSGIVGHQQ
eukprot:12429484-Karenia_brevis.AAC.1